VKLEDTLRRLEALKGYTAYGESPRIKLDANENLFLPRNIMRDFLREVSDDSDPRLYPAREAEELTEAIAKRIGVDTDQIVLGGGGDQIISLLTTVLLRPGDGLLSVTPTFSMYPVAAYIRGVEHQESPLDASLTLDSGRVLSDVKGNTRMVEIVNPNNPTGVQFEEETVKEIALAFDGPLLLDEAYADYGRYSLAGSCGEYRNLMILRTFSKAYGLAGLRLGYLIAESRLASALRGAQDPYPASGIAIRMGLRMLEETRTVEDAVSQAKKERAWLTSELSRIQGVVVIPSDASFLTFKTPRDTATIHRVLLEKGVAVRFVRGIPGHGDCLRVTVAPRPLQEEFLMCLMEALS
jgi:histidinol-phosphate aminotransferase